MENIIWRDVKDYEGLYMVSNSGLVKSRNRILKPAKNKSGYLKVVLCRKGEETTKYVHQLVAESFLNHSYAGYQRVVDHINEVRTDNRLENLRIISNRENIGRAYDGKRKSKFIGVYWDKINNKWQARGKVNKVLKSFGRFDTEKEAYEARLKGLGYA